MRKNIFPIVAAALVSAAITPAWAAGPGAGGSHGATVSAAAMSARQGGQPVGMSVRTAARVNSQGPLRANASAISHVQNSTGQANANSVLGNGAATSTTGSTMSSRTPAAQTLTTAGAKARGKGKGAKSRSGATVPQH